LAGGSIGLELYAGVDRAGAESALDTLDAMGAVLAALDDLGPMATRAVRGRVRRVIG
jgi:hypothetical protein